MQTMQSTQSESKMSRPLNEKEQLDISTLFGGLSNIDFKDWSVQTEVLVQTSKQTVDNAWDTWADFFIPHSQTLLGNWYITGKIKRITTAGVDLPEPTTVNDAVDTSVYSIGGLPKSTLSLLQSVYILSGNSAGDILFEIN